MAGRLAAVPEESMDGSTVAYPPRSPYRDLIRRVAVSRPQIRSTLFSHTQSGHSGSSYCSDSASNSYPSDNSGSGCSSDSAAHELSSIVRLMVSDGYIQRMVQAFSDASPGPAALGYNGDPADHALNTWVQQPCKIDDIDMIRATPTDVYSDDQNHVLHTWFLELDVDWVLQIGLQQLRLQDNSGSSLQDLVDSWIRGLSVIVHSIVQLQSAHHKTMTAVKRFCEASIFKMHVFLDAMVPIWKAENLGTVLDMHTCLGRAVYHLVNSSAGHSKLVRAPLLHLSLAACKLRKDISSTVEKVMKLVEDDDSWAIEIPQGGGEVHRNTRSIAHCIVSLGEAESLSYDCTMLSGVRSLSDVRSVAIARLEDLLVRKSELCSDPSLRYLFLLNNSYFAAHTIEPWKPGHRCKLTSECEKYMDSYLDVSWGHVLSCIPSGHFPGMLHRWMNTDPLVKFESAFNKTCQAQKFWKVPDPELRDVLRSAIARRVVSSYRDYVKEHPAVAEHVSRINSTPNVFEEMLGQLFEG